MAKRVIRPKHLLPVDPVAVKRRKAAEWKDDHGPNGAYGSEHVSGWRAQTVGGYSGSAAAMMLLLWTPKVFGPDRYSTVPYRRAWPIEGDNPAEGMPTLFESLPDAKEFFETVASKAQLLVNA